MKQGRILLLLALAGAACSDDGGATGPADGGAPDLGDAGPPDAGDPTAALFASDHLVEIEIEMAEADWDELRTQTRSLFDILGGNCLAEPFPSPFTFFGGAVTVDGTRFEETGVRKKGFLGSLDDVRPSLKIKFDEYVPDQEYLGLSRLTLNNARQDPSFAHQCLSYGLFRVAGVPAPRCNFARVTVNGEELGLYVNVESVDKSFLERHFADPEGNLYEGTLSDFRDGWTGTFEKKTNEMDPDRSDLDLLVTAGEAADGELKAALEAQMDLDGFYTFWATELMTSHWDGYAQNTNNFFVYRDPSTQRFSFMPWGTDGAFQDQQVPPPAVFATGHLARRLYLNPPTQDEFLDRLTTLIETHWDEDALIASIDEMETVIERVTPDAAMPLDDLRDFVMARGAWLLDEIAMGPPPFDDPPREAPCLQVVGSIDGTFVTTWGTIGMDPFASGTGTLDLTVFGITPNFAAVGANSGLDQNPEAGTEPRAIIQVPGLITGGALDGQVAVALMAIQQAAFDPGLLTFDFAAAYGALAIYNPADQSFTPIALFGAGNLTLTEASMVDTQAVEGSFTADLVLWPF
jgi:hypothetical protein